jgi:hypothetical protein
MIEVKASEVLDRVFEKQANKAEALTESAKKLLNNKKINQKLLGAGIGAGTGALAGSANSEHKGRGALTGATIGAAGGALGGSLAEKRLKEATRAARNKGFAAGTGIGTLGGIVGSKLGSKGAKAAKSVGSKGLDAAKSVGSKGLDAAKAAKNTVKGKGFSMSNNAQSMFGNRPHSVVDRDIINHFKNKPEDYVDRGIDYLNSKKDTLKDYASRVSELLKNSSEHRDAFGTAAFNKIANEQYTAGQAVAELVNCEFDKIAMEETPAEEYVEKIASEILQGLFE